MKNNGKFVLNADINISTFWYVDDMLVNNVKFYIKKLFIALNVSMVI